MPKSDDTLLPFDRLIDVVFIHHELFTFYGGEGREVPEELVAGDCQKFRVKAGFIRPA